MINLLNNLKFLLNRRFPPGESLPDTPLCVMDDKVFKKMLTSNTEDSRIALRCLLSACTRREVTAVKVLNSELLPVYLGGKSSVLDVRVTFNDGEAANLEMQMNNSNDDLKKRAVHYSTALQYSQARKGFRYKDIKRTYQIFFVDQVLFKGSGKLPQRFSYREETEHNLLTDAVEIIFYELPKLKQRVNEYFTGKTGIQSLSNEEKWCIFFKYHHEDQAKPLIEELCKKEEGIMHARKQVEKLPRSYLRFMTVEMDKYRAHIDRIYEEKALYDEGHAEGCVKTEEKWQGVIADYKTELADKDAEIADHKAEIADKDAEIARLQAALNTK